MENKRPQISVVILCYGIGDFVPVFVAQMKETLQKRGLDYELVLVGNYLAQRKNTDRTPEIIRELARQDPRLVAVVKEKQGMMGWDMRSGLEAARGEVVAVIDGDGQMPPEDIVKVYDKLTSGGFDMAKTYRDERYDGLKRKLISKIYNFILKILFPKVKVKDANSKPKIFTRETLSKLRLASDDWFIDAEMIIKASYLELKIGEIPTFFRANENRSSLIGISAIFEFLANLIAYRFNRWFGQDKF